MKVIIDASEVTDTLQRIIDDRIFRTACFDSIALISLRIQNKGLRTNESPIGIYSAGYAKQRAKKGRQTSYIDLTLTGDMIDSLTFDKATYNEYVVGFGTKSSSDKADWNEERYGSLFALGQSEIGLVQTGIENNVNAAIGR